MLNHSSQFLVSCRWSFGHYKLSMSSSGQEIRPPDTLIQAKAGCEGSTGTFCGHICAYSNPQISHGFPWYPCTCCAESHGAVLLLALIRILQMRSIMQTCKDRGAVCVKYIEIWFELYHGYGRTCSVICILWRWNAPRSDHVHYCALQLFHIAATLFVYITCIFVRRWGVAFD